MAVEVPLFPLGTVLFPHMPMSLHIFEDRYKTMMRDCRRGSTTFGIVAIRSGQETGGSAIPYDVGTLAQLDEVEELDDGGYNLVITGASRFHIDAFSHRRPYLVGSVRYLQDIPAPADDTERLAAAVTAAFRGYAGQLRGIGRRTRSNSASLPIRSCSPISWPRRCRSRPLSASACSRSTARRNGSPPACDCCGARRPCSTACWFARRTTPPRPA